MSSICRICKKQFHLTDRDQEFYKKIKVPSPAACPQCRLIRRMTWRNDRTFYRRKCSKTNHQIISMYPADTVFPVYEPGIWYSDAWDPMDYGQEVNFKESFFTQLQKLRMKVPRLGIDIVNCENSDFCNYCGDDKNCYLDIAGEANEDCYYNLFTKYSKNCVDCTFVYNSELVYEAINCYKCYNVYYSFYLENCSDSAFCFDMKGCSNCLFSTNLRQKQYHIFNKPYSKEEYFKKREELKLDSYSALQKNLETWKRVMRDAIHRDMFNLNSENCVGNEIKNSKNCDFVFNVSDCEDSRFLYDVLEARDCYDLNYSLYKPELSYELISTLNMHSSGFSMASHYCSSVYYCDQCNNSSDLFGCIGLNRKQYCILNKQYSKEDYFELKDRLIEHMKKTASPRGERHMRERFSAEQMPLMRAGERGSGSASSSEAELIHQEWGEFFPSAHSPFAYNETVAQEYFPLTKEQALSQGFRWKDPEEKGFYDGPQIALADSMNDVSEDIVKNILVCEVCGKNYKLIIQEFHFYKKFGLPVPRKCSSCRHKGRLALRNPRQLWNRKCSHCTTDITTSYSLERSEKVYCEKCYLAAVY